MSRFEAGLFVLAVVLLTADPALAYRPFVSTDAAVADPGEFEFELGALTVDRTGHENTFTTPSSVVNYGVRKRLELVAQFNVQQGSSTRIPECSLRQFSGKAFSRTTIQRWFSMRRSGMESSAERQIGSSQPA